MELLCAGVGTKERKNTGEQEYLKQMIFNLSLILR